MEYKQVKRKNGELVVFCNFEDLLKDFYEVGTMEEVETHVNNSTGEYIIHCPFCREEGHTKHKLYIKSDLTVGHCFVCGRAFVNVTDEVKVDYKVPNFFPTLNKKPGVNLVTLSDPVWSLDKYYNEFDDFDQKGYDFFNEEDDYILLNVKESVENDQPIIVQNQRTKETLSTQLTLAPREKTMILQGGLLNAIKELGGDF